MSTKNYPTKEQLHQLFEYRDGYLFRKIATSNSVKVGDKAGFLMKDGYIGVSVNSVGYKLHRIIFMMHHGYFPKEVDHIDNNKLNNKIENLRAVTRSQNNYNSKIKINNSSGFKNVWWSKQINKWVVELRIDGIKKSFGCYHDINVAKFVSETMRHKYYKDYARSN